MWTYKRLAGRLLALACLLTTGVACASEDILSYHSDILVRADGSMLVTETIQVRSEGNRIRRGIYRDFPTRYRDRWGNRVTVGFRPLSVRRNGSGEPWHSEDRSNGVRVYFGSASRLLEPGVHEYEFLFETDRQLGFFEDHDELYFNAVGTGWVFPIDQAVVASQGDAAARQELEQRLLDLLAAGVSRSAQDFILRTLKTMGTAKSVPALAALPETDRARLAGIRHSGVSAIFDKPLTVASLRGALQRLLA